MHENLSSTELKRLHRQWRKETNRRVSLIIAGTQGPYNIGSIIRTAAAERIDHIWFLEGSTTPENTKTGKTALGSERFVEWSIATDGNAALKSARSQGYKIVALELASGAEPIHIANLKEDACFVIGHEDRGIPTVLLDQCDLVTYIPQLGKIGSLNVAIATSIALYEFRRQEWNEASG
tara:strand:+ start:473 stop:1009 length:537 start_codon:yes stop_codon:yes gene_type:complete